MRGLSKELPPQLSAKHVTWSGVAGILIVVAAGAITYLFTKPHGSSQWADVIRSIVLAVAAMGAFPAAYVAYRKQRFTEADHRLEQDKEDRRRDELTEETSRADRKDFNDRFTTAAQQIGSDTAPVRLAGVYAMAQLADEWGRLDLAQRQTCINVLCAYLRMPWPAAQASLPVEPTSSRLRDEETRVREAILRVTGEHIHKDRATDHWHDNVFDLTGAELPVLDFQGAIFGARFVANQATFVQDAGFDGATFAQGAGFAGATFGEYALVADATFAGDAWFGGVTFTRAAVFNEASFEASAVFDGAAFADVLFTDVTFAAAARFDGAKFAGDAGFDGALVSGDVVADQRIIPATGKPRLLGPLLGFPDEQPDSFHNLQPLTD